ncbi:DCC1-like thiol-disulfide oxidoreductase family protein [Flavobacterium sp. NRK F10]|uniref:Thiol-disulfide oxidoreductase n=1 Tax=Flavobacterium sediminis TaxID=2201181 RepID=A0A2U8QST6_9FLAO|nr:MULTISPECIES: DCC1-like thiol-disulfide oxidoreductase family protein [Flavobacterium]AWM13159.1 hypothetical protein DI487_04230 [Flavobacterium sediminis]MCO6174320.1 DCC1-like thiol-disulfide oxidoreductase family protein [Flavobacterium sp. NRK F10]
MNQKVVFFDGICAMCNYLVLFVLEKDKNKQTKFISLQSQSAKELLDKYKVQYNVEELTTIFYLKNETVYTHSDAILELLIDIKYYKTVAKIFKKIPVSLRNGIYSLIADKRYFWFGKTEACQLLTKEERSRIIE